jgi:hypothetical protein
MAAAVDRKPLVQLERTVAGCAVAVPAMPCSAVLDLHMHIPLPAASAHNPVRADVTAVTQPAQAMQCAMRASLVARHVSIHVFTVQPQPKSHITAPACDRCRVLPLGAVRYPSWAFYDQCPAGLVSPLVS